MPLVLLGLAVSGCAASRAAPIPRVAKAQTTKPAPRANPALEGVVGRMLAVDSLVRQTDTLLQSGFAAQAIDLPDSARINYGDAGVQLDRAGKVFFRLGTAGPYQSIADAFGRAIAGYSSAVADSSAHNSRSQKEAANARTALMKAESALNATAEAGRPGAVAAESAALSSVTPRPARHKRTVHRATHRATRHHHSGTSLSGPPAPHRTPITFRVVIATPTVTSTVTPTATPSPTSPPTDTPVPTPTATPRVVHHATKPRQRAADPRVLAAMHALAGRRSALHHAFNETDACRAKVAGLAGGTDPTGEAAILSCLQRSLAALTALHLADAARTTSLPGPRGSILAAAGSVSQAIGNLRKAQTDLQAVDLPATQGDLEAATAALAQGQVNLKTAATGLRAAR